MKYKKEDLAKMDVDQYTLFKKQALAEQVDTTSAQFKMMQDMMQHAATQGTAMELNNLAWSYVETMKDKADWTKALAWSARAIELDRDPNFLDTYANLLYKLGKKDEAIKIETEALEKAKVEQREGFMETLEKMKKGTL